MFSLIPLVRWRNTQDERIGLGFGYFCDRELLEGRSGSFSENLLILRSRLFCRGR